MAKEQCRPWRPEELEVLDRYLALVAKRRYRSARQAAEPCRRELCRRKLGDRSFIAVHTRMVIRGHQTNSRWPGVRWSPAEMRVIRRYARALVHAEGRTASSVVLACQRDLRRLPQYDRTGVQQRPPGGRSEITVCSRLRRLAHTLGWSLQRRNWDARESVVLRKYARAVIEGRFRDAPSAARACRRELEPESRRLFDAHVVECRYCQRELAVLTAVVSSLEHQPVEEPSAEFTTRVLARLPRQRAFAPSPWWALALAPVLGGLAWLFRTQLERGIAGLLGRLVPNGVALPAPTMQNAGIAAAIVVGLGLFVAAGGAVFCWRVYLRD